MPHDRTLEHPIGERFLLGLQESHVVGGCRRFDGLLDLLGRLGVGRLPLDLSERVGFECTHLIFGRWRAHVVAQTTHIDRPQELMPIKCCPFFLNRSFSSRYSSRASAMPLERLRTVKMARLQFVS